MIDFCLSEAKLLKWSGSTGWLHEFPFSKKFQVVNLSPCKFHFNAKPLMGWEFLIQ